MYVGGEGSLKVENISIIKRRVFYELNSDVFDCTNCLKLPKNEQEKVYFIFFGPPTVCRPRLFVCHVP